MVSDDFKFETEYIISLTVLILTFLTADSLKVFLNFNVALIFLLLVAFHLVIFNATCMFSKMTKFEIPSVNKLKSLSRCSFIIVLTGTIYIMIHIILMVFFGEGKKFMCTFDLVFVIPLVIVVIIMFPVYYKIIHPILLFKKIEITTSPDGTNVYSSYDDSEPLFVKIENTSKKTIPFEVEINFPDDVIYMKEKEGKNKFEDNPTIISAGSEMYHINMKYEGAERKSDMITVIISSKSKKFKKNIQVFLENI